MTLLDRAFALDDLCRVLGRPLSDEQAEVVRAPLEAGVVVAGAGSGKTATMVARVVWLVARGEVAPDGVLGLTFTSKAADELAQRTRAALRLLRREGLLADALADLEPTISTYHAYAGQLVRDHALRLGREPTARLITPATSWQLAARAVATYEGPLDAKDMAESTVVQAVLALAGDLAEHLVAPDDVRALGARLQEWAAAPGVQRPGQDVLVAQKVREQLLPIVEAYRRTKRSRELLDFGDVVALAAQLARDCPEVGELERAAHRVVLLDEYQDTGAAQEVLLASLYGGGHPVTAVGDPCQSIYGWRGASAGTLRRFGRRFGSVRTEPRSLSTNYRSGGRVLRLANVLSRELRADGVRVAELAARPGHEDAGLVRVALLPDVAQEARWVAGQVRVAVLEQGPDEDGRLWAQAAVLCRKRSMFARLRSAFEELDVPVEVVGLGGLLTVPEVADLVATLTVLDDPTADAALLRLLTGPRWRIGPRDLAGLGRRARELARLPGRRADGPLQQVVLGVADEQAGSLVDALDDLPRTGLSQEGRRRLGVLAGELRGLRSRADQPLPELVADVERTLGLDVEVAARPGAPGAAEARADLDAFADAAARFTGDAAQDGGGEAVLTAFLAYLVAAADEEHGLDTGVAGSADTVKLMTVHAAKGLEWPVVAVPGLARAEGAGSAVFPGRPKGTSWATTPRLLPFPLRGDSDELPRLAGLRKEQLAAYKEQLAARDAREERRLAYVAVTRAERLLLCSGYHWGEGRLPLGPSVFLLEARQACQAGAGEVDVWTDEAPEVPLVQDGRAAAWPSAVPPAGPGVQRVADRVRALVGEGVPGDDPPLSAEAARQVAGWDDDLRRLAEEARRRQTSRDVAVLPAHLSVTSLVELQRDPTGLARSLLRPLPLRPSPVVRRGTAFHTWLERAVFGAPQLLDPFELPGSADAEVADRDLEALQAAFRRSPWWGRRPREIEVPFEMAVEGLLVRGRIDAVFVEEVYAEAAGGQLDLLSAGPEAVRVDVVDWKTGRRPSGPGAAAAAVQLAAYRLAWHQLSGTPLEQIGAAFHYVAEGVTVRPADLLDADGLRALVTGLPEQRG